MVPLNEAWQSGAFKWDAATRTSLRQRPGLQALPGRGHRPRQPLQGRQGAPGLDARQEHLLVRHQDCREVALAPEHQPGREELPRRQGSPPAVGPRSPPRSGRTSATRRRRRRRPAAPTTAPPGTRSRATPPR
nr:hypothetical protein [Angustibacter aerolatus]